MAGKNIKGLTVEIGGDTTSLSKALEGVNKKSKDLSSELGEINKLLKLDPKNTDLLSQKQKVLADAVGNTKEKLDKLKEAEKQVQQQFKKGEVSEEQVRALQREIIATEKKLDGYENAVKETNKALKGMDDASEDAEKSTEGLGSTMSSVAKGAVAGLVGAVTAVVGSVVAAAEASREYRTEMGKLETGFDAAGHSAETAAATYKTLQGVIGETDQSVEAAQQIALLAASEEDAAKWADLAAGVVGRFGDALQPEAFFEAANETLKLNEATSGYTQMLEQAGYDVEKFNAGLAACNTEQEKQAYMLEISDQLLGDAADKYREVNAEVIRANQANEQWASVMGDIGAAVEPIITDIKMMGASLVSDLVPGVQTLADAFRGVINGEDGAADQMGTALGDILSGLVDKVVEIAPALLEAAIGLVLSLTESLLNTLSENLPVLLEAVISGASQILTSLGEMLPTLIPIVISAVIQLAETLLDNVDMLIDAGIALLNGLADGLIVALPQLIEKLPIIIDKAITVLSSNMPKLIRAGIQLTVKLAEGLIAAVPQLIQKLPEIIASLVDGFKSYYGEIGEIGSDLIKGLWNGIQNMASWIGKKIKGFGETVLGSLKDFFGIKSPSRVFRDVIGKNLALGLADGIDDNADAPLDAMTSLSDDLLGEAGAMNGLTLERQLNHTFTGSSAAAQEQAGMLAKLDSILAAIERRQILTIDGKALVGATAGNMDNTLGQRRALAARGAL